MYFENYYHFLNRFEREKGIIEPKKLLNLVALTSLKNYNKFIQIFQH